MTKILGIETSCDDTGIAVVEDSYRVLTNAVSSQVLKHAEFGGVVPEIASREHTRIISQMTEGVLADTDDSIDAIATTHGPGLMGSLLVGFSFGKALAFAMGIPFIPVHHIEGHIFSPFLDGTGPQFPALALIVSGGHTQLILCRAEHDYEILGSTRDDAVGECFDKVARLLDLPYPGGPSIQREAENGDPKAVEFPRAMAKSPSLEFSYSGLKTAVLYELQKNPSQNRADIAASFQAAAVDVLLIKTKRALEQTQAPRLIVAGGVAANALLRTRLTEELDVPVLMPSLEYCADNGAMIAAAGQSRLVHGLVGAAAQCPHPSLAL